MGRPGGCMFKRALPAIPLASTGVDTDNYCSAMDWRPAFVGNGRGWQGNSRRLGRSRASPATRAMAQTPLVTHSSLLQKQVCKLGPRWTSMLIARHARNPHSGFWSWSWPLVGWGCRPEMEAAMQGRCATHEGLVPGPRGPTPQHHTSNRRCSIHDP
jgi:hypothetical protein